MNNNEQRLTCAQVRAWDMVDYLSRLGHNPHTVKGNDYWYLSPLRNERTASFKINRKLNRWYDHGMGRGGNLIDFAILYHNCTIAGLLKNIAGNFSFQPPSFHPPQQFVEENKIQGLADFIISSVSLVNYLEQRHIPSEIADKYCREVRYRFNEKIYYAIGFKNDAGGYELRNKYFKNNSSPKSITMIKNGANKIAVFEGFFDFLSFLVLQQYKPSEPWDFCILNSLSFFEKSIPFLAEYETIHLFLDNDTAGQNCRRLALKQHKKCINESSLYAGCKDLNELLIAANNTDLAPFKSVPP